MQNAKKKKKSGWTLEISRSVACSDDIQDRWPPIITLKFLRMAVASPALIAHYSFIALLDRCRYEGLQSRNGILGWRMEITVIFLLILIKFYECSTESIKVEYVCLSVFFKERCQT